MTIQQIIQKNMEEFEGEIQERKLNEDNPQYVLGWNACRYLSKSFLSSSQQKVVDEIVKYIESKKENWALGLTYMADEKLDAPFETAEAHLDVIIQDLLNFLKEK